MPHKKKKEGITMEFKRETIEYAEKNSSHKASEKFNIVVKRVRELRQNKLKISEPTLKPKNKSLEGGGKTTTPTIRKPISWIYDRRSNGLPVSRKIIMAKAKYFYESECSESENLFL